MVIGNSVKLCPFAQLFMKAIIVAVVGLVLAGLPVSASARWLVVLQHTAAGIAVLECDCYENPSPPCRCCYSTGADQTPCADGSPSPRVDCNHRQYGYPAATAARAHPQPEFAYKLNLRNDGPKTIQVIDWEYIFIDRETQTEVARHQFRSEDRVRPGKRKTLVKFSTSPPTKVISVRTLSRPEADRFIEKVAIKRVTYKDGSIWENQSISE